MVAVCWGNGTYLNLHFFHYGQNGALLHVIQPFAFLLFESFHVICPFSVGLLVFSVLIG